MRWLGRQQTAKARQQEPEGAPGERQQPTEVRPGEDGSAAFLVGILLARHTSGPGRDFFATCVLSLPDTTAPSTSAHR